MTSFPSYQCVELDAMGQAILLQQLGINESFKILPTIPVNNPAGERIYYLIPDGTGNWARKQAGLEADSFEQLDKRHQGNFRPTVRLLKYWNRQSGGLPEEDWEWLALKVFQQMEACPSVVGAIAKFFARCPALLVHPSFDFSPEGIELKKRWGTATLERARATLEAAATQAQTAIRYEEQGEFENAIAAWRQIFKEI
ncbi:MAG: hypothetical protein SW833_02690 [Cyanobacteriota bacterium]|nr:hypothetical protein [Cyanobacteriota bacterium]